MSLRLFIPSTIPVDGGNCINNAIKHLTTSFNTSLIQNGMWIQRKISED